MQQPSRAQRYSRLSLILSLSSSALSLMITVLILYSGVHLTLRNMAYRYTENPYGALLLFSLFLGLVYYVAGAPLSWLKDYWLEHRYGLSNQNMQQWLMERLKVLLLGMVLFLPLLLLFFYFFTNHPHSWWLWTATALFIFSVVLGKLAPQLIFPLFYKFEPLEDPALLERMKVLAKNGNFNLKGVYRFDMSKTTNKANAAFTGMGKGKRIIIGDTLLNTMSIDEIETVFAHEVGHYVYRHITWGLVTGTLISYGSLWLTAWLYGMSWQLFNIPAYGDVSALPLLGLILTLIQMPVTPLQNMLSRFNERQADRYALEHSTKPQAFPEALRKLAESNLSDPEPPAWEEFLFHSHPSVNRRLAYMQAFLKDKGVDVS